MDTRMFIAPRLTRGLTGVAVAGMGIGIYMYTRNTIHADSGVPKPTFGTGPAFLSLQLESTEDINHNTRRLRFKLPEPNAVSGLSLTSSLLTFSWPKGSALPVLRPYTPISSLDEPGVLEFLVKRYPKGKQSSYLHSLRPGDSLRFVTRLPGYKWSPNEHSNIMLLAGGAGITPAYQLIRGIFENPQDQTKITLVFGVNTEGDLLLRKEFSEYEAQFPGRFKVVYTISQPTENSRFRKGYIDKDLLKEVAPASDDCKVFVCGPPQMESALVGGWRKSGILEELGYRKDQVYKF